MKNLKKLIKKAYKMAKDDICLVEYCKEECNAFKVEIRKTFEGNTVILISKCFNYGVFLIYGCIVEENDESEFTLRELFKEDFDGMWAEELVVECIYKKMPHEIN